MTGRCSSCRGFTLIELLAVTAILAVLVAVAVPRLFGAIDKAKIARAIAEISTINKAVMSYRAAHDGNLPADMAALVPEHLAQLPIDPWGMPYVYNNFDMVTPGERRKDGPLVPINKEYDIFSCGPNQKTTPNIVSTQGRDDIIMANDGDFINVAAEY